MSFRLASVETRLNRADFRWRVLRLLRKSMLLGAVVCLVLLFFGGAILLGLVKSKAVGLNVVAFVAISGLIILAVIVLKALAGAPDRRWLAAVMERTDRRFLDRLNTLVFLESKREEERSRSFAERIARQAQAVMAEKEPPSPFPKQRPLAYVAAFLLILGVTIAFFDLYSPWSQLQTAQKGKSQAGSGNPKPLEVALPGTNNVEQRLPWGEVRITDPGSDLKVTKIDVVPLQIEAAANQPLKKVSWSSTVNGAAETTHELPPPIEPRYATYHPTFYLDELNLSDWDVVTYYARANTSKQDSYASDVYFIEVRPFREDILKMPGGEGGKAYQSISEISSLINRQQHVIRQTHQHLQKPSSSETARTQDRMKLSEAEGDLGGSVQHLYAQMASQMENQAIGETLDNLAKAEKSLGSASKGLADNAMAKAQNHERSALSELIAARKMFQKAVSDNPGAFGGSDGQEEHTPVAQTEKKLSAMAEFRNEAKAAQEFVQQSLEQQKTLEQQLQSTPRSNYSSLANQEQELQKDLQDFQAQHPQAFQGSRSQSADARQAMQAAADSLQRKRDDAGTVTHQATRNLAALDEAMRRQAAGQQLGDSYKLKQMLDEQSRTLDQRAKQDKSVSDADAQKAAGAARQALSQLKKTAEESPTRDAFGQPLRDALNDQNKAELDSKLSRVENAGNLARNDGSTPEGNAAAAAQALGEVSKAFEQSQPSALQQARKEDALKPGGEDPFGQGMAELDSLIKQMENGRNLSPEERAKQGKEALSNLQTGMRSQHGDNEGGESLLHQMEQMLRGDAGPDYGDLKKLLAALQRFSVEASERKARKEDQSQVANIDPARLSPAYRGRIQKYFQKLSEE